MCFIFVGGFGMGRTLSSYSHWQDDRSKDDRRVLSLSKEVNPLQNQKSLVKIRNTKHGKEKRIKNI
jgi:hypothetical protein